MIRGAVRIAKAVKKEGLSLPVIFGGWHPSLVPGQTLQENYVDAVVRGQGDLTLLEIAQKLSEGKDYRGRARRFVEADGNAAALAGAASGVAG